jgi:tetratricopeptide (TPR) repeat protein
VLGSVFNQIRMFPNHTKARFRYRVHEQVLPSLQELGFSPFFTDVMVMHTGYSTPEIVKQKQVRNLAIMEKEIVERPDNPVVVYSYAGNLVDLERWQEAIPYYEKAMRLSLEQKREEHIALGAPVALASLYGRLKDYANSRKWADEAYKSDQKNVQLHSILGELCEIEGKTDEAVRWYESVLSFEEAPVFIPVDFNMLKINACTKLGRLYMQKGDQRRAIEYLDRALKICRK